jgi:hypothetical protein
MIIITLLLPLGTRMEEVDNRYVREFVQIAWWWKQALRSDRLYLIQRV